MKICARPCQRLTDQIIALVSYVLSRVLCPEKSIAQMENQQEQLQIKQLHIFTALTMIKRMRNQNFNPLIQDFNQHALRNKSY